MIMKLQNQSADVLFLLGIISNVLHLTSLNFDENATVGWKP